MLRSILQDLLDLLHDLRGELGQDLERLDVVVATKQHRSEHLVMLAVVMRGKKDCLHLLRLRSTQDTSRHVLVLESPSKR